MGRPLRIEYPGAFYHVTSRGNEQRDIFKSKTDREKFLSYLGTATERYGAAIHAYCLMDNHYHLLLATPEGNLSQIMRHINGAYTNYFNAKQKRAGHLLQGRYKALLVEQDAYALELSRYIHLNPVRAGKTNMPEEYHWSSYRSFIGTAGAPGWLRMKEYLKYFDGDGGKYQRFVEDSIGKGSHNPTVAAVGATILGRPGFVKEIEEKHLVGREPGRDVPDMRRISCRWAVETIITEVNKAMAGDEQLKRKMSLYLCHRYSGARLKEIGVRFGIGESAVSQESRRFGMSLEKDTGLKEVVQAIRERLTAVNV
jgi:putative transposase